METRWIVTWVALAALAGCESEGSVTLPEDWNALKSRTVVVTTQLVEDPELRVVRTLNGIDGAPAPIHPDLPDLRVPYWRKSGGGDERDGARLTDVRVGPGLLCDLALDRLFPDPARDPNDASAYAFDTLDARAASVDALTSASIILQLGFAQTAGCVEAPIDPKAPMAGADAERWAAVAANTVRHLTQGSTWDPAGATFSVTTIELLDGGALPAQLNDSEVTNYATLYERLATAVAAALPETDRPAVAGGGMVVDPSGLASRDDTPIARFIARIAAAGAPLDQLTFGVAAEDPWQIVEVTRALRALLDSHGLTATTLALTSMTPTSAAPSVGELPSAHLGAFEMAARIYLQDEPVAFALSGPGPAHFADGLSHAGEALDSLGPLLIDSAYFTADGAPRPAFMARMPLRARDGEVRVQVTQGSDQQGMAVLASRSPTSTHTLNLIIANANVGSGGASVTYDLVVKAFVPPAIEIVDYRLSQLAHRNTGLESYFFSDVGSLRPNPRTGDVHISRELPVPGVHFIQLDKPTP